MVIATAKQVETTKDFIALILRTNIPSARKWFKFGFRRRVPLAMWRRYLETGVTEGAVTIMGYYISCYLTSLARQEDCETREIIAQDGRAFLREIFEKAKGLELSVELCQVDQTVF
jgi:hypothetical protein